jgi:hypothetical protein
MLLSAALHRNSLVRVVRALGQRGRYLGARHRCCQGVPGGVAVGKGAPYRRAGLTVRVVNWPILTFEGGGTSKMEFRKPNSIFIFS